MKRNIIAFTGLMKAGKSTAALRLMEDHNYRRIRFAGPLKDMAYAFGLSYNHIEGELKELPCDLLAGKTPRQFMQLLGTEFGRNMIDPELWVKAWEHAVNQVPEGINIVADDCRFPNEALAVRRISANSRICRIVRYNSTTQTHASELQTFHADCIIENKGTMDEFLAKIDKLASRVANSHRK